MIKKITRLTRIAIISTVAIIISAVVMTGMIYYFYPENSVKEIIRSRAEHLLERKVEIGSLHYSPKGVVIYDVRLYDRSEDNGETLLIKADEIVITFSLLSVIKKDFTITTLYFSGLDVNIIFDDRGKSNIQKLISGLNDKTAGGGGDKHIQLSKAILNDCRLKLTNPPQFVKPLEGEYRVDSTLHIDKNRAFNVVDTKITLPHKRGILYPELDIMTDNGFIARGRVKVENASLQWVYKFPAKELKLPFDVVNGQVNDFEITKSYVKGHARATSTIKNSKSVISADGWCTVEIGPKNVLLKDISGKINTSSATVDSMHIAAKGGGVKQFDISNISFQMSDLKQLINLIPAGLSGGVKGALSFDGTAFNGRLDLSGMGFTENIELFRDLNTSIDINKNIIKKENMPAIVLGSRSMISIATTDSKFKNFYISVNSEKINLNDIKMNKLPAGTTGDQVHGSRKLAIPVNITAKLNVQELIYNDFIFKNTRANITATGATIKINNVETSILSGIIAGMGSIDISGDAPTVQTFLKYNNIKIHEINFKNEKLKKRLFGAAEGTANLNMVIKENAAETFKGHATFTVTKGKVVNTGIQDGLIVFLSELRYKLKDLEFNKIYGNISITGNVFQINSFIFNSEDLRVTINGQVDRELTAKNIKMKLEFNNHFIKDLPRPATLAISEYLSGKWYLIPFSIEGNITDSKNIKMLKKDQ